MLYQNSLPSSQEFDKRNYKLIELIVAKHRNGPTGKVTLAFNTKQTKFQNIQA